jgi:hypothetical protein
MVAILIARFDGDIQELTTANDRAHALMSRGGAVPSGVLVGRTGPRPVDSVDSVSPNQ